MSTMRLSLVLRRTRVPKPFTSLSLPPLQSRRTIMDSGITKDGLFATNNTVAPRPSRAMDMFNLKGRTAVISGGPAGIGLSIAQTFAEAGANVAIWYNSNTAAHDRAAEIEKEYGVSCAFISAPS